MKQQVLERRGAQVAGRAGTAVPQTGTEQTQHWDKRWESVRSRRPNPQFRINKRCCCHCAGFTPAWADVVKPRKTHTSPLDYPAYCPLLLDAPDVPCLEGVSDKVLLRFPLKNFCYEAASRQGFLLQALDPGHKAPVPAAAQGKQVCGWAEKEKELIQPPPAVTLVTAREVFPGGVGVTRFVWVSIE